MVWKGEKELKDHTIQNKNEYAMVLYHQKSYAYTENSVFIRKGM